MHVCIRLSIRLFNERIKGVGLMQETTQEQRGGDRERRRERKERGVEHNKATLAHHNHSHNLHVCNTRLDILANLFNAHTHLYIHMYAYVWWMYHINNPSKLATYTHTQSNSLKGEGGGESSMSVALNPI